jgi:hypothetical protein
MYPLKNYAKKALQSDLVIKGFQKCPLQTNHLKSVFPIQLS